MSRIGIRMRKWRRRQSGWWRWRWHQRTGWLLEHRSVCFVMSMTHTSLVYLLQLHLPLLPFLRVGMDCSNLAKWTSITTTIMIIIIATYIIFICLWLWCNSRFLYLLPSWVCRRGKRSYHGTIVTSSQGRHVLNCLQLHIQRSHTLCGIFFILLTHYSVVVTMIDMDEFVILWNIQEQLTVLQRSSKSAAYWHTILLYYFIIVVCYVEVIVALTTYVI